MLLNGCKPQIHDTQTLLLYKTQLRIKQPLATKRDLEDTSTQKTKKQNGMFPQALKCDKFEHVLSQQKNKKTRQEKWKIEGAAAGLVEVRAPVVECPLRDAELTEIAGDDLMETLSRMRLTKHSHSRK